MAGGGGGERGDKPTPELIGSELLAGRVGELIASEHDASIGMGLAPLDLHTWAGRCDEQARAVFMPIAKTLKNDLPALCNQFRCDRPVALRMSKSGVRCAEQVWGEVLRRLTSCRTRGRGWGESPTVVHFMLSAIDTSGGLEHKFSKENGGWQEVGEGSGGTNRHPN